jgi:hypothetical protein
MDDSCEDRPEPTQLINKLSVNAIAATAALSSVDT